MEKSFPKTMESLEAVFKFIQDFAEQHQLDKSIRYTVDLTIEEIFTNMVRHGIGGSDLVPITLKIENGCVVMELIDIGAQAFDITKHSEANINLPLKDRKIGGLGLHLVKEMADSIDYEYENGNSKITILKKLET